MKFFLLFLLGSFVLGKAMATATAQQRVVAALVISTGLAVLYFFVGKLI